MKNGSKWCVIYKEVLLNEVYNKNIIVDSIGNDIEALL